MRNSLRFAALCVSFVIAIAECGAGLIAAPLDLRAKIDPLAKPLVNDGIVVGFVVGIIKDGQTQIIAYGETEKGSGRAPDADTVYEIGSISKVFTGILLADMVERGLVAVDDPVQKLLPAGVTMPIVDDKPITLEHLSTHTSGLPRLPDNFKPADPTNPYADYTVEQMYDFLKSHKLRRPPGTYEYSNYGVALLGQLLTTKADTTYEKLLAERITQPTGMSDTRIELTEAMRKRLAPPYNGALKPEKNWDLPTFAGAGGIRSTTRDMLRFAEACLADDDRPLTLALKRSYVNRKIEGEQAMGLGWHIARDGITRLHSGMTGGYHTWLAVVPDHDIATVVMANTATGRVSEFGEQVTRIAFGLDVKPAPQRKEIAVAPDVLARYVGSYRLAPRFALNVTVEEGKLMIQGTGQPQLPVFAESETKFFSKVVDARFTFVADADNKFNKLILHQNGRDMEAVRETTPPPKP